ncbi:MAG: lysophospholipid acyltransferase family protein [Planctomycetota bacterium]|nr:lysophospholipid acyltransferase family protein [Planctomycetota bacterium]
MERRGLNFRKFLLGTVLPVLRRLPLPLASRVVAGIGKAEYRLHAELRQTFLAAVDGAARELGCPWDVPAVSLELAGNQVRWRTRDLLLDGVPDARAESMFRVEERSHLDDALALGKGAIVLACHFGGHLLPAHWLFRQSYPLRFYMERPRHISRYMARQFETDGPLGQNKLFISRQGDTAAAAGSILRAARVLQAGMLIYIAGDVRWAGPHAQAATFLGKTFQLSATWVNLAALTGAPVVPVFCQMQREGTYHIEFHPRFHVPSDAVKSGQAGHWVQTYMSLLEEQVRRDPANSNEYFFWGDSQERPRDESRAA